MDIGLIDSDTDFGSNICFPDNSSTHSAHRHALRKFAVDIVSSSCPASVFIGVNVKSRYLVLGTLWYPRYLGTFLVGIKDLIYP